MKRTLFLIFSLLLLWVSCDSDNDKQYVIGVAQCSTDTWRAKMNAELQREAYLNDDVSLVIRSAYDNSQLQVKQIKQLVKDGIDLLIVSPNEGDTIAPIINEVYESGIPVVLVDRSIGTDKYTAYIGADNTQIGRNVGEYIASRLKGKGSVMEIAGLPGSTSAIERSRGFHEVIDRYPDIHIDNIGHADWLQEKSRHLADSVLALGNHYDFVFGANDRMAVGAYQAAQKRGINDMHYVGIDALASEKGGIECVDKGILDATFIYPTRGDLIFKLAMQILEGKNFHRENILYSGIVDKNNASTLLNQSSEVIVLDEQLATLSSKVDRFIVQYNNQKVILYLAIAFIILHLMSAALIYRAYASKVALNKKLEQSIQKIMKVNEDVLTANGDGENVLQDITLPAAINVEGDNSEETAEPQFIVDFRRTINEHMDDSDLNVEQLSALMGLSRVQLYRKVKALTGNTPVEIMRIARLKRADRLLKSDDKTISEIAYEVGFSSPSYFTKCYKEYYGHLPKEK